jgi:hypothetical protein
MYLLHSVQKSKGVPSVSRSTVLVATAHLFLLMSISEVHAQDACGCGKIVDPRARAACLRGCYSGGTFQLQSTGRSAPSTGSPVGVPKIVQTPKAPPTAPPAGPRSRR